MVQNFYFSERCVSSRHRKNSVVTIGRSKSRLWANDHFRLLHLGIELREHLIERHALGFRPVGRDPVNPGRVCRDGKVRRVNDETVPAFRDPVAVV